MHVLVSIGYHDFSSYILNLPGSRMFKILPGLTFNFLILVQIFLLVSLTSDFHRYGVDIQMKWSQDRGQVLFFIAAFWITFALCFPIIMKVFFSGQPEIIALSELLRVNCCVWEIRQGYAEVIFRHLLPNPILGTSTVHLHYASRNHYEFTDVGKVRITYHISIQTHIES